MILIPEYDSDLRERNETKLGIDDYPCVICGKPIKNWKYSIMTYEGAYAVTEDELKTLDNSGDSGAYPIGSHCLKKHPELKPYAFD